MFFLTCIKGSKNSKLSVLHSPPPPPHHHHHSPLDSDSSRLVSTMPQCCSVTPPSPFTSLLPCCPSPFPKLRTHCHTMRAPPRSPCHNRRHNLLRCVNDCWFGASGSGVFRTFFFTVFPFLFFFSPYSLHILCQLPVSLPLGLKSSASDSSEAMSSSGVGAHDDAPPLPTRTRLSFPPLKDPLAVTRSALQNNKQKQHM